MSILVKGMKMPTKGEYELRLFCHSDGTATLEGFPIEFEGEPFEVIEGPTPHGRLIDADALYEQTVEWEAQSLAQVAKLDHRVENQRRVWEHSSTVLAERTAFKHDIADMPTIIEAEEGNLSTAFQSLSKNAEPVKRGKWIYDNQFHWYRASCSECGYKRVTDIKAEKWNGWKYCPNCGAKMEPISASTENGQEVEE